jgi:hypothetical protein
MLRMEKVMTQVIASLREFLPENLSHKTLCENDLQGDDNVVRSERNLFWRLNLTMGINSTTIDLCSLLHTKEQ